MPTNDCSNGHNNKNRAIRSTYLVTHVENHSYFRSLARPRGTRPFATRTFQQKMALRHLLIKRLATARNRIRKKDLTHVRLFRLDQRKLHLDPVFDNSPRNV